MNAISTNTRKSMLLFSGRGYPELADEVAGYLGSAVTPQSVYDFANGEIFVRPELSVRGTDSFIIQSCGVPINKWVMETLIMIDALKRASAKRITVVLPFYPYARQDKKHRGREPISARLIADLLKTAGAHRLMVVDLHTDQVQGFFDGPVDHLFAQPLLTDYISAKYGTEELTVVSPDSGRVRTAERWANRLGGAPIAFIHKTRDPIATELGQGEPGGRRGGRPDLRRRRRHDRHRRHHRQGGPGDHARGRREGRRRRYPWRAVRPGRRPAQLAAARSRWS